MKIETASLVPAWMRRNDHDSNYQVERAVMADTSLAVSSVGCTWYSRPIICSSSLSVLPIARAAGNQTP
jgi:hypothetical protein